VDTHGADDLLSIGRFARLSGLSVGALRHYDELDLLRPASVDQWTGYRSYRRDQLPVARTIGRLRDLEIPLDAIRELLAADDPVERRRLLSEQRDRIRARTWRLQRVLHVLTQMTLNDEETGPMVAEQPIPTELDEATRRRLAADLFNHTWELLEMPSRTQAQDDEMLHCAHASRYHWGEVGNAQNLAVGEWQCSRVYAVLGRVEPAVWHARRCLEISEANEVERWCLAAAYEAMARVQLLAGDRAAAKEWVKKGRETAATYSDPDDVEPITNDLDELALD
jgi:DNA-binding transcriptional MerR regulator